MNRRLVSSTGRAMALGLLTAVHMLCWVPGVKADDGTGTAGGLRLATGGPSGIYLPMGRALAQAANKAGRSVVVLGSTGS